MTIGEVIQMARKEAGLTQVQLGDMLGVSGAMIGQWENNLRNPKSETVGRIADALGEPFMKLFLQNCDEWSSITQKRLDAIRMDDIELFEEKFQKQITEFIHSPLGRSIIVLFFDLNFLGQKEAEKRIRELVEISKFQRTESPESISSSKECRDTSDKEKPPEEHCSPSDGT